MSLVSYLGKQTLGVLAGYKQDGVVIHICGVYPNADNSLRVFFPHGHEFAVGDLATIHLDNRSGVDEFDANIQVYRASYKGRVVVSDGDWVVLEPRECQLLHGFTPVLDIREPGYQFPQDDRPSMPVPLTPMIDFPQMEKQDFSNKVGVLITMAAEQPHTTVLAFLSSVDNDIFLITFPETFKSQLLKRNPHCFFAMDERSHYTFERTIEWNYTIIEGEAFIIERDNPLYEKVRHEFVAKNPWEIAFFTRPDVEVYHIKSKQLVCPGNTQALS
ncbi:hypothetical protein [Pectobacterium polaris]|uniref:hypothetical protein n=1 Tax=Pectobacterium polaris TaxID=2042057 RepID=UPI00202D8CCE|nr:hypothetical protein [Pectobacterium polaris]MCL6326566.1 hypothetical protein [Pectobacterium polaris]